MSRHPLVILENLKNAKSSEDRIDILKKNCLNNFLRVLIQGAMSENVKFIFKERVEYKPNYNISENVNDYINLYQIHDRFYLFVEDDSRIYGEVSLETRKKWLVQILESIHPEESELLMKMILKNLEIPQLTKEEVNQAWPNFL